MSRYERVKQILAYENRRVSVFDDLVRRPDGQLDTYFRVRYKNGTSGAVMVPELPDGRLLLIRIHRYAFDDDSLEFPRGGARADEAPEDTAARELLMETSLEPTSFIPIGHCRSDTSIMQVDASVFLARLPASAEGAVKVNDLEAIQGYSWHTREDLLRMAWSGTVRDGFTLSALSLYSAYLSFGDEAPNPTPPSEPSPKQA